MNSTLTTPSHNRNESIDLVRVFAAFGVVAIHVKNGTYATEAFNNFFTIFCVPFFYVISLTYFIIGLKKEFLLSDVFSKMWGRIVLPYLVWTVIYLALLTTKKYIVGGPMSFEWWKIFFYGNSAVQLYFLPQLIMMQLLITGVFFISTGKSLKILQALAIISIVVVYLAIGYDQQCFGMTPIYAVITFITGAFALASIFKRGERKTLYLIIGVLIILLSIIQEFIKLPFALPTFLRFLPIGGIGIALIAFNIEIRRLPRLLSLLAAASFGIYLCHVIFLEAFEFAVPKIMRHGFKYDLLTKIWVTLLLFTLSALFIFLVLKFKSTRLMLLGKKG